MSIFSALHDIIGWFGFYRGFAWAFDNSEYLQAFKIIVYDSLKLGGLAFAIFFFLKYVVFNDFKASKVHGSAAWATEKQAAKKGLLKSADELGGGMVIGKFGSKFVEIPGHVFICAPTRSGKGVGPIVSTAVTYLGSMIINDPKGELYCVTQAARRELGQNVVLVDPFGVIAPLNRRENLGMRNVESAYYNPLQFLDSANPNAYTHAKALTEAFCAKDGSDDHFDRQAKNYITSVMLYLCECRDKKINEVTELFPATMPGVRDFLASGQDFTQHVATMRDKTKIHAVLNGANGILQTGEKELGSILSSITGYIAFLDSPQLREFFSKNTVPVHSLYYTPTTIYYVSPASDRLEGTKIARLLFADALLYIQKAHKDFVDAEKMQENVLFLLDEFPQMLRFELIAENIGLVQGIGATFCTVCQDIGQMRQYYRDLYTTFPANSSSLFLGAKDIDTATNISKTLGNKTEIQRSADKNGNISKTEVSRALMTPDEILEAGPARPIFFPGHMRPLRLQQLKYFNERALSERAAKNPFCPGDKTPTRED